MEFTIRAFVSLKPKDVLVLDEDNPGIHFKKKESRDLIHFFDALPANRNSYGENTLAYLENLEEPEDD